MLNLIETFKVVDLQHVTKKSKEFQELYKDLLEKDGKSLLVYSGHFDQFPFALSYEEYDLYREALRNLWLDEGESWETIEEWEDEPNHTGINF